MLGPPEGSQIRTGADTSKMQIDGHSPVTNLESSLHCNFRRAAGRVYLIRYPTKGRQIEQLRLIRLGEASKTVIGTKTEVL